MSLLKRAKDIRRAEALEDPASELGIVFDKASGISEEDQRDILRQIEKVSQGTRISAPTETLKIKAQKRGLLFPVIVNIAALLTLAAGLFGLFTFFQRSEHQLRQEAAVIRSAEGRLIREIKKEAEALVRHKDEEISSIMARLGEIDRERRDLHSNMELRILQREEELRQELEKELDAERSSLRTQGLSESIIAERLKAFEEEKSAQFRAELDAFKVSLESERQAAERSLEALQSDFQDQLKFLHKERDTILADSRAREAALRSQLEERTQALEAKDEASRQSLARAQTDLRLLEEQRERATLLEAQISGFFSSAGTLLEKGQFVEARKTLASLKDFLSEPAVLNIPEIQERRGLDLAIADMLIDMIDDNLRQDRESFSILEALQKDSPLEQIRKTVTAAEIAEEENNIAEAEELYRAALALIPEVLTAHHYLIQQNADLAEEQVQLADQKDAEVAAAHSAAIAALRSEKAAAEARLEREKTDIRRQYEALIAGMEGEIRELRRRLDEETAAVAAAASAPAATQVIPAATQQELQRLEALEVDLNRVKTSYAEYSTQEDGLLRTRDEEGILEAKLLLDTFLASEDIRRMFPGLDDRIKRYDRAFQVAGADEALLQASDIALRLSSYKTRAEKDRYLAEELARHEKAPPMKDYLKTLREFTR